MPTSNRRWIYVAQYEALSICHVPSGPWTAWKLMPPEARTSPLLLWLVTTHPLRGIETPWTGTSAAVDSAAASGDAAPPFAETSENSMWLVDVHLPLLFA
jgi:hypothetical protein